MTESRFVLDTNAIIFLTTGDNEAAAELKDKLKEADLFISVISEIELFSKPKMAADEEDNLRAFLSERTIIIDLTEDVKMKLSRSAAVSSSNCLIVSLRLPLSFWIPYS